MFSFFFREDRVSSNCVILLTKKQNKHTNNHEFNTSLAELIIQKHITVKESDCKKRNRGAKHKTES